MVKGYKDRLVKRLLEDVPPRVVVCIVLMFYLFNGIEWVFGDVSRSKTRSYRNLVAIGRWFNEQRPMALWGVVFLSIGSLIMLGLLFNSMKFIALALLVGSGYTIFYGVITGDVAFNDTFTNIVQKASFSILISYVVLTLWQMSLVVMLWNNPHKHWR